jgi:AcrR family transcriptional regulator
VTPSRGPRAERGEIAARILSAARTSFATNGFVGSTLRSIAHDADVDPTLVSYYFGNKRGLLEAALDPPPGWLTAVATACAAPLRQRGRALTTTMARAWEDPDTAEFLRSTILTAVHEPVAMDRLRSTFTVYLLGAVATNLDDDERFFRAGLVASQFVGLALTRYIWQVGNLADVPIAKVIDAVAPTVQRYLSGKII